MRMFVEKQAAETRIQALLACLPWIPTFLGLVSSSFSSLLPILALKSFEALNLLYLVLSFFSSSL